MRFRCIAILVLILGVVSLLGPGTALGQTTPTSPPTPSVSVAPTSVPLTVKKNGMFDTRSTKGQAIGSLLVVWPGSGQASVVMSGYYSDGASATVNYYPGRAVSPFPSTTSTAVPVPSDSPQPIAVCVNWPGSDTTSGWLVMTDQSHPGPPITVPFTIKEFVPGGVLARVLGYSAAIAAVLILIIWVMLRRYEPPHVLAPLPTWTFGQSWATNLTALAAILGTILGASGFLSDVLPGLSVGMFVGFNLVYGALVLLAPLVFQLCSWNGKQTYPGLLAAGWTIMWALIGELGTAVVLLWRGGMLPAAGWAVFAGGIGVLFFYTRASMVPVIKTPVQLKDAATTAWTAAAMKAAHAIMLPDASEADAKDAALKAAAKVIENAEAWSGAAPLSADALGPTAKVDTVMAASVAVKAAAAAMESGSKEEVKDAAFSAAMKATVAHPGSALLAEEVVGVVFPWIDTVMTASGKAAVAAAKARRKKRASEKKVEKAALSAARGAVESAAVGPPFIPVTAYMI